jgi:ribosomal protein S4E
MIGLHDGRVIRATNDIETNDSVKLSADGKGIGTVLAFGEGKKCMIIDGVHVGSSGTIKKINKGTMHSGKTVLVEDTEGNSFETLVRNIMVFE